MNKQDFGHTCGLHVLQQANSPLIFSPEQHESSSKFTLHLHVVLTAVLQVHLPAN